ncbi:MAG: hypothetical protein IIZ94_11545 [Prevotella sp.]|nr:hypothetical protein [Prevotella sp.]
MANLITEIYDKQAVVDNLNQLGELINSSLNAIVASAPKLQSPIEYLTAVQSISEIEKKNTEVTQAKAKALSDLDKAYQQADKAMNQSIALEDEEYKEVTKLTNEYKERAKEQKQLLELERVRQQTMKNSAQLLSRQAQSEGELRKQTAELIKAQQSLRVTNAEENKVRQALIEKINANKVALKGMTDEVSKQKDNIGNYKSALEGNVNVLNLVSSGQLQLKEAMKLVRTELTALEAQQASGNQLTAEQRKRYNDLSLAMGQLSDIQGDISAQTKVLADDYRGMTFALESVKLGVNIMTSLQAVTSLVGDENEELQKTMAKIVAVQQILNTLSQIENQLNSKKEIAIGLRIIKEKLLTTAIGEQTKAQIALNTAKLGLIGLLAGAVTGLTIWIAKMASAKNQVAELTKTINEQAIDAVAPTIQKVNDLKDRWSDLGGNLEAQKQFISDNAGAFDELGISLTNVNDAEKFFSEQTQDFIDAQINRAKAEAARAQMTEIIKQQLTAQLEYERRYNKEQKTMWESVVDWYNGAKFGAEKYAEVVKQGYEQEQKQYDEQIKSLSEMANGFDEIANKLTANIPTKDKHTEATKKQTEAIKEYNSEIEKTLDIQNELFKSWDEQEKQAKKLADMLAKAKSEMADFEIEEEDAVEPVKTLSEMIKEQEQVVKERTEAVKEAKENLTEAFESITNLQLDNLERESDAYDENYERRRQVIENTVMSEAEKDRRLKALDNEKTAHDKQVAKERAQIERRQAIFKNAIQSAEAMSNAVASVGLLLRKETEGDTYSAIARYIAAIAAGVSAVTTVASLISQLVRIPAFEKGGTAQANKPFIAGEKGREIGFGVYSGKVYDFSKPTIFKANEPINIKNATETKQIINNNEYNKDVTLHNEVVVNVIDNKRVQKYFKIGGKA